MGLWVGLCHGEGEFVVEVLSGREAREGFARSCRELGGEPELIDVGAIAVCYDLCMHLCFFSPDVCRGICARDCVKEVGRSG